MATWRSSFPHPKICSHNPHLHASNAHHPSHHPHITPGHGIHTIPEEPESSYNNSSEKKSNSCSPTKSNLESPNANDQVDSQNNIRTTPKSQLDGTLEEPENSVPVATSTPNLNCTVEQQIKVEAVPDTKNRRNSGSELQVGVGPPIKKSQPIKFKTPTKTQHDKNSTAVVVMGLKGSGKTEIIKTLFNLKSLPTYYNKLTPVGFEESSKVEESSDNSYSYGKQEHMVPTKMNLEYLTPIEINHLNFLQKPKVYSTNQATTNKQPEKDQHLLPKVDKNNNQVDQRLPYDLEKRVSDSSSSGGTSGSNSVSSNLGQMENLNITDRNEHQSGRPQTQTPGSALSRCHSKIFKDPCWFRVCRFSCTSGLEPTKPPTYLAFWNRLVSRNSVVTCASSPFL